MTTSKTLKPLMLRPDQDFNKDLASVIVTALKAAIAPLKKRLDALEARGPGVEYRGIFREGEVYERGSLCTRSGALWLAIRTTALAPGAVPDHWRLIVKEGRAT